MTIAERLPTGRIAAVGILLAAVLLIWFAVLGPLVSLWGRRSDQADRAADMIVRLGRSAAEGPAIQQQLARLGQNQHDRNAIILAPNANVGGAMLQSEIKRIAESDGLAVRTIQQLPPVAEGALNRIGVRVDLEADTAKLGHLLAHLEGHTPIYLVQSLSIHGQEQQASANSARPVNITVQMEITGLTGTPE
jgi:hypothetical protein